MEISGENDIVPGQRWRTAYANEIGKIGKVVGFDSHSSSTRDGTRSFQSIDTHQHDQRNDPHWARQDSSPSLVLSLLSLGDRSLTLVAGLVIRLGGLLGAIHMRLILPLLRQIPALRFQ